VSLTTTSWLQTGYWFWEGRTGKSLSYFLAKICRCSFHDFQALEALARTCPIFSNAPRVTPGRNYTFKLSARLEAPWVSPSHYRGRPTGLTGLPGSSRSTPHGVRLLQPSCRAQVTRSLAPPGGDFPKLRQMRVAQDHSHFQDVRDIGAFAPRARFGIAPVAPRTGATHKIKQPG
jgi:hypothetical protein